MDPIAANAPRIVHGPAPTRDFTAISNAVLRDERLSYRARGVLAEILSHGPDWVPDATEMSQRGAEGRDAIRGAFSELESAGYLVRTKVQSVGGLWATVTTFYANPQVAPKTDFQASVNQSSDSQASVRPATTGKRAGRTEDGKPVVGFPGAIRKTETKEEPLPAGGMRVPEASARPATKRAAAPASVKIEPASKRGTPLPEPFEVTEAMKEWVRENCPTVNGWAEHEKFCDYHRAKGTVFKKWDAAWRNWMRKASEFSTRSPIANGSSPRRSTTDERVQQGLDLVEYFGQLEAGDAESATRKGLTR